MAYLATMDYDAVVKKKCHLQSQPLIWIVDVVESTKHRL